MNYRQLSERAAVLRAADGGVRICVSARHGSEAAERCFEVFSAWAHDKAQAAVIRTGSTGLYDLEPLVMIEKPEAPAIWYAGVTPDTAGRLLRGWLDGGDPLPELALGTLSDMQFRGVAPLRTVPELQLQKRLVTRRCGLADPGSIDDSIAGFEGYGGLEKALRMTPAEALKVIERAALRERDGVGNLVFPPWKVFLDIGGEKVLVCRALDNDADAHGARLLLEGDPHGVLEGLLIAAYAVGAGTAVLTVPSRLGTILPDLDNALSQMRECGLVGQNILESGFGCEIQVREAPPRLVMSDKTALLRGLEGRQPIPALPARGGDTLDGRPALTAMAETLANLGPIFLQGPEAYAETGIAGNSGTKLLTVTGDVSRRVTLEVPFGIKLRALVCGLGGQEKVKAVQLGGPTSVFFDQAGLEKSLTYETAREAGAELGLTLLNVSSKDGCAVETAAALLDSIHGEGCGKCVFCREGTLHLRQLLGEIAKGTAGAGDLGLMTELGLRMRSNCLCALGRTAANPVLSGLDLFRPDYEHHLKEKTCPRGGPANVD